MRKDRLLVILIGLLLPYLARLPKGSAWLMQYLDTGAAGLLFFAGLNAIAWLAIFVVSFWYRNAYSTLAPALLGFGFLAWAHYGLDLRADAQAAIALIFIPIYALAPILIGAIIGYLIDRRLRKVNVAST